MSPLRSLSERHSISSCTQSSTQVQAAINLNGRRHKLLERTAVVCDCVGCHSTHKMLPYTPAMESMCNLEHCQALWLPASLAVQAATLQGRG